MEKLVLELCGRGGRVGGGGGSGGGGGRGLELLEVVAMVVAEQDCCPKIQCCACGSGDIGVSDHC